MLNLLCCSPFTGLVLGTLMLMVKLPLIEMGKNQTLRQKDMHTPYLSLFISDAVPVDELKILFLFFAS